MLKKYLRGAHQLGEINPKIKWILFRNHGYYVICILPWQPEPWHKIIQYFGDHFSLSISVHPSILFKNIMLP